MVGAKELRARSLAPEKQGGPGTILQHRRAAEHINANSNVEGLCWELPQRLDALCAKQGDRLKK